MTIKSYEGNISGLDSDQTWRQSLAFKKKKNALPNPIKKNQELIELLKKEKGVTLTPAVILVSGNRGYILSQYLYSPNQFETIVPINSPKKYKEEELEAISNKLK